MFTQLFIALFGVTAVALTQSVFHSRRKWAPIFGLIGQPFWFYAAYTTQQWGIFALCFLYTATWAKGFYSSWLSAPIITDYRYIVIRITNSEGAIVVDVVDRYPTRHHAAEALDDLRDNSDVCNENSVYRMMTLPLLSNERPT